MPATPTPIRVLELRSVRGTGGGPEKTVLLGAARSSPPFQVVVCYIRDQRDEGFRVQERVAALKVDYVEVLERHSLDVRVWTELRQLVRDRQIDIVHAHEYKTDLLAWLLARRAGIIPLATAHGWTGQSTRERYAYYPIDKRILTRYPRVIAVSSEIKDELVRSGAAPDRVTVILNAIDPEAFRRVDGRRRLIRQQLGYTHDEFVIGAVGRLERQKRFDLLIEAVAALARTRAGLRLVIVGDGALRADLTALAGQRQLGSQCDFLGHRHDIVDLHHAFDLFVQSSEYEGTSNAVLEAMALETPIVATDVGGTAELALPNVHALIIPPHDLGALEVSIEAVRSDPVAARRRADAARRRIETDLSFDVRTRTLEALYADLVRERLNRA